MSLSRSLISAGAGATAGIGFLMRAWVVYTATPSDPQKAVGYVFIIFYSLIFGGAVSGLASSMASLAGGSGRRRSLVSRLCVAGIYTAIVIGMLVHFWPGLFP